MMKKISNFIFIILFSFAFFCSSCTTEEIEQENAQITEQKAKSWKDVVENLDKMNKKTSEAMTSVQNKFGK